MNYAFARRRGFFFFSFFVLKASPRYVCVCARAHFSLTPDGRFKKRAVTPCQMQHLEELSPHPWLSSVGRQLRRCSLAG